MGILVRPSVGFGSIEVEKVKIDGELWVGDFAGGNLFIGIIGVRFGFLRVSAVETEFSGEGIGGDSVFFKVEINSIITRKEGLVVVASDPDLFSGRSVGEREVVFDKKFVSGVARSFWGRK